MNRRSFLNTLVGGIAAGAAVRTWPFRVFSFPATVAIPQHRFNFIKGYYPLHSFTVDLETPCVPVNESLPKCRVLSGFAKFMPNPKCAVIVDGEVCAIKSWDPTTERLIVIRGSIPEGQLGN